MRSQTKSITVPVLAAGAQETFEITLDRSYTRCRGIGVPAPSASTHVLNSADFRLGVRSGSQVVQDLASVQALIFSPPQPANERYMETDFPVNGEQVTITVQAVTAVTAPIQLDLIFLLDKPANR